MNRKTGRRCLLGFGSLGLTLLVALMVQAVGAAKEAEEPAARQALRDDDRQILELVLLDLIEFKEFSPAVGAGKKTQIFMGNRSVPHPGFLQDSQLDGESHNKSPYLISSEIRADLNRRNTRQAVSLSDFKPKGRPIIVGDLTGLEEFGALTEKYPEARGYVVPWLPGYAKDGNSAILRMRFGPTAHGATVTYFLIKKEGRWTVSWRKVAYYA